MLFRSDDSQNGRELEFRLDFKFFESRPIARTGFGEEEFQGAVSDVDGAVAPLSLVLDVEEVIPQVILSC